MGKKAKIPGARVTLWIIRPDMERICVVEPIEDLGVRQLRTVEALDRAVAKARAQLGAPGRQLKICK